MSDTKSKLVSGVLVLILMVAGYQAVTNTGEYIASEILHIPVVNFWVYAFLLLGIFVILILGISPSSLLK